MAFKIKIKLGGEGVVSFTAPSLPPQPAPAPELTAEEAAERKRRKRERRERERAAAEAAAQAGGGYAAYAPAMPSYDASLYAPLGGGGAALAPSQGGYKSQLMQLAELQRSQAAAAAAAAAGRGGGGYGSAPHTSRPPRPRPATEFRRAPPQPPPRSFAAPSGRAGDNKRKRGALLPGTTARTQAAAAASPSVGPSRRAAPDAPKRHHLEAAVQKLSKIDREGFFQDPVTDAIAPNYSAVVARPMDFTTIRRKMRGGEYGSWDELGADVALIVSNCLLYNGSETVFSAAAVRLREAAERIVQSYKENNGRPKPEERRPAPPRPPVPVPRPQRVLPSHNHNAPMQLVPPPQRPPPTARPAAPAPQPQQQAPRPAPQPQRQPAPRIAGVLDGRRGLSDDENRRATFKPRGYSSRLLTVHGELAVNAHTAQPSAQPHAAPQVAFRPAPGPGAPDGYARSIARFAALLGPRGRALAMARAAEATDPLPPRLPLLPVFPRPAPLASRPVAAPPAAQARPQR